MPDDREIDSLVSLLADEDPKIYGMVADQLLGLGATGVPHLKRAAEAPDPRLRLRARHLLHRIVLDGLEQEFAALSGLGDEEFDLERGCAIVARIEYPDLPPAVLSEQLDEIAGRIRPRLQGVGAPLDQIRVINQVLYEEYKFTGNSRDYYEPDNVYLNRVLERRTGIPISLAAVYLLVTRRLELPFDGVGLPSNFLIRYGQGDDDLYIDPFLGGKLLGRRDCVQYLTSAGYYYKDAYISSSTARDIIVRTLRHLIVVYSKQQDKSRMSRLTRYAELLQAREKAHDGG
jgi:regulator of sirC expression with transglutaminase-like and TPR domain